MTKWRTSLFVMAAAVTLLSCSEDSDKGPAYEFKDQIAQGKIDGDNFVLGEARVEFDADGEMSIDLFSNQETDEACEIIFVGDFSSAFFTTAKSTGVVELFLNLSTGAGQTVTLFNPESNLNTISSEGAIEITAISDTEVSGKIDAQYDSDNFVNGNFTAILCE